MSAMPWWLWAAAFFLAVLALVRRGANRWRAMLRAEFLAYLRREAPEVEILAESDDAIELRTAAGGQGTLRLDRLYSDATEPGHRDPAGRAVLFSRFARMLREGGTLATLDVERDRARLLPRLVTDGFLAELRKQVKGGTIPGASCGVPGLAAVFVLDSATSVAYANDAMLRDLGLTPETALMVATENLAHTFDPATVRRAISEPSVVVVKKADTFDAARVLLVPRCLEEGEEVVALIPDRDTLVLTGPPSDGDWSGLRKLAQAAAGPVLWDQPLLVTRAGIAPAPSSY